MQRQGGKNRGSVMGRAGVKRRLVAELQGWAASCNAFQLINKWRDYHVFTIWYVLVIHSAIAFWLPPQPDSLTRLSSFFVSVPLSFTFLVSTARHARAAPAEWQVVPGAEYPSTAPLRLTFAYTAFISQAVIGLALSTLLGPPQQRAP